MCVEILDTSGGSDLTPTNLATFPVVKSGIISGAVFALERGRFEMQGWVHFMEFTVSSFVFKFPEITHCSSIMATSMVSFLLLTKHRDVCMITLAVGGREGRGVTWRGVGGVMSLGGVWVGSCHLEVHIHYVGVGSDCE